MSELDINVIGNKMHLFLVKNGDTKRKELLQYLRSEGYDITDREMRAIKEDVMTKFLIGSNNERGYFIIKNIQDLNDAKEEYWSKIKTMIDKIKKLEEAFWREQNALFDEFLEQKEAKIW